jgi:quercetin dioxygenase-like cupin family protein
MIKAWMGTTMTLMLAAGGANAEEKAVVIPLAKFETTISGQQIAIPAGLSVVSVSSYEIPAGAALPQHRHAYPRYGYVISGKLRVSNAESGAVSDFSAGDFVVESIGQWHSGENPGLEPLQLLVIDQAPDGVNNVEPRP